MTVLTGVQVVLAGVAAALVGVRFRELLFVAPVDMPAVERAVSAGAEGVEPSERLSALAAALAPAWVGRLLGAALAVPPGAAREAAVAEARADLLQRGLPSLYPLVALGRLAMPVALVNVILELSWAFRGGSGLVALQKGLAAQIALGRSLLALALGLGTMALCLVAVGVLRRAANRLERALWRAEEWLDQARSASVAPPPSDEGEQR